MHSWSQTSLLYDIMVFFCSRKSSKSPISSYKKSSKGPLFRLFRPPLYRRNATNSTGLNVRKLTECAQPAWGPYRFRKWSPISKYTLSVTDLYFFRCGM